MDRILNNLKRFLEIIRDAQVSRCLPKRREKIVNARTENQQIRNLMQISANSLLY